MMVRPISRTIRSCVYWKECSQASSGHHRRSHVELTHWGWVTHICVSKLTIIGSDNGLSPVRRQAIIWTNAGILLILPLGTNFSEILIRIKTFSFKKIHLKKSSGKCRPFCLGLNVLTWPHNYNSSTPRGQRVLSNELSSPQENIILQNYKITNVFLKKRYVTLIY